MIKLNEKCKSNTIWFVQSHVYLSSSFDLLAGLAWRTPWPLQYVSIKMLRARINKRKHEWLLNKKKKLPGKKC